MKQITLILFTILSISSVSISAQETYTVKEVQAFVNDINTNDNIQIIDVRTPEEYAQGHIDGAININFYANSFAEEISKLNKEKPTYIYCRSGKRSARSSKEFINQGFKNIVDLKGGFIAFSRYQSR